MKRSGSNSNLHTLQEKTARPSLAMMRLPVPKSSETSNEINESEAAITNRLFTGSLLEKVYFFTGTPERILKWRNTCSDHFIFFEVISTIIGTMNTSIPFQRKLLLRDARGPVLKVVFYENQINPSALEDLRVGVTIRCVGHMSSNDTLTATTIRKPSQKEMATVKRHYYIGDFSIAGLMQEKQNC